MVIFYSYVELPEGNFILMSSMKRQFETPRMPMAIHQRLPEGNPRPKKQKNIDTSLESSESRVSMGSPKKSVLQTS